MPTPFDQVTPTSELPPMKWSPPDEEGLVQVGAPSAWYLGERARPCLAPSICGLPSILLAFPHG
jgi:hypothetical protein